MVFQCVVIFHMIDSPKKKKKNQKQKQEKENK